jgi:SAM-dependent methyltransferase
LERWWLAESARGTGIADPTECLLSLEKDVARLSDLFTTERPAAFDDYTADERLCLAYGLFFFPQNFVRTTWVIGEWLERRSSLAPVRRILDLGSGLGASTLAALHRIPGGDTPISALAVDRSSSALRRLQAIHAACPDLWPGSLVETRPANLADLPSDRRDFDLIMISFALNESPVARDDSTLLDWTTRQIARLAPGGAMIIIEPASHETSPRLQRLRDNLLETEAAEICAPCLHRVPCPMRREGAGWCHEVRRWQVPSSTEKLNRKLFRSLYDLKFSFVVFTRPDDRPAEPPLWRHPNVCRLVAPVTRQKGRIVTAGCFGSGQMHDIEQLTRHLKPNDPNPAKLLERGDILRVDNPAPIGDPMRLRVTGFHPLFPTALALLLSLSGIRAAEPTGPFYTHNQNPIARLYGIPAAEDAFMAETGIWETHLVLDLANNSVDRSTGSESVILDGETYALVLAMRRGFSETWEAGVDLPWVSHQGGVLDGFIEPYHDALGLPQGNRKARPGNRLDYSYSHGARSVMTLTEDSAGLGDIRFALANQFLANPSRTRAFALRAGLELPTGDSHELLGSGSTDISLALAGADRETLAPVRLDASVGVLAMTPGQVLDDWQEPVAAFGSIAAGWNPGETVELKLQLDWNSPLFHDIVLTPIESWATQLVLGGTVALGAHTRLDMAVAEDLAVATTPDVVFHFALNMEM